jgi:hypothetical protein
MAPHRTPEGSSSADEPGEPTVPSVKVVLVKTVVGGVRGVAVVAVVGEGCLVTLSIALLQWEEPLCIRLVYEVARVDVVRVVGLVVGGIVLCNPSQETCRASSNADR